MDIPSTIMMAEITCYRTNHGTRNPRSGRGGLLQTDCEASQVVIQRNPCNQNQNHNQNQNRSRGISRTDKLKIATWNVRSMYEAGKIHNAIKEMKRLRIDILGVSEMRC